MLQVFRVEHKHSRVGPFQTNHEFTQNLARRASICHHLKHPGDDGLGLGDIPWCYVFGSPDLESLKRWVLLGDGITENERIVQQLDALGFVLAEYLVESDRYLMGASGNQLAFDARESREEALVEYHQLAELLKPSPRVFDMH
jgi:hypothetical protein